MQHKTQVYCIAFTVWQQALQEVLLDSAEATLLRRAAFHEWQRNADAAARGGHHCHACELFPGQLQPI